MIVINGFSRKIPLTDDKGCATQWMQILGEQLKNLPMIAGTGSPEGVYPAQETRLYMDRNKSSGYRLWIKTVDAVAGNPANGWEGLL
jgi:hypothetical protein